MVNPDDILALTKIEKLKIMELIWSDLSGSPSDVESPDWHEAELKKTAQNYENGSEIPVDWKEAKKQLIAERK